MVRSGKEDHGYNISTDIGERKLMIIAMLLFAVGRSHPSNPHICYIK